MRLRIAAVACLVAATNAAGQGDPRLTIHGGASDFLALAANSSAAPVDLVRFLLSSPGSAADGAPFPIAGAVTSQCAAAKGVAIHPSGRFVYLASDTQPAGSVCAYEFDARALTLTPVIGSPFPAGRGTRAIAVDPAGKFVYATNFTDGSISGYSVDNTTGELRTLPGSAFISADANTGFVVVDPLGRFVYSTNSDVNTTVSGFAIDRDSGGLTPVPFSPLKTPGVPGALAIDPRGKFLFVAASPNQVYAINQANGQLVATGSTFGPFAQGMAVDPLGRYLTRPRPTTVSTRTASARRAR